MAQNPPPAANIDQAFDSFGRAVASSSKPASAGQSLGLGDAAAGANAESVALGQTDILKFFYKDILAQAQHSFFLATASAAVGFALLIGVLIYMIAGGNNSSGITITAIAGVIVQVVTALQFYLYNRTTTQMGNFHARLMRLQRFLIANELCNSLTTDTAKDTARANLVNLIASAEWDKDVPLPNASGTQPGA